MCGLFDMQYDGLECPRCRSEGEEAKTVIELTLRKDGGEKARLILDFKEWLGEPERWKRATRYM